MVALSQFQLDQLISQLRKDYQSLLADVRSELENAGDQPRIGLLNREPGDSSDESMANSLADLTVAIVDRQVLEMRDIESALQRVKDKAYGVCIDCGDDIAFTRLQAYLTTKRCLACQEKYEREYASQRHPGI